jgi:hypothetical protein
MNKINQNLKKLFSQGYCVVDNVLEDVECKKFITHLKNINQNLSKNLTNLHTKNEIRL